MTRLPPGWEWAALSEILATQADGKILHQGWSPRCLPEPSPSEADWGVLKTTAIQPGHFHPEHNKLLPESLQPRQRIEVTTGDLLLTCAGPRSRCGVACLVTSTRPRLMLSGKMYRFRVDERHVTSPFLNYYLQSPDAWRDIDAMKTGGNESGLNLTQARFRKLRVPVAPRAEQERIVAALEEHLSRLDAAETLLRNVDQQLAALEQRLIDTAADGDATPLGSLLREPLRNGMSARASADGSVRVVTITTVTRSEFTDAHTKMITPGARPIDDLWMQPGDIFVQRSNTPELVGTAALYDGPGDWAIFPDLLIRVRCNDLIDPAYLATVLRSTRLRRFFTSHAQGIAGSMPKISQPTVESAPIPLPSLRRQREILSELRAQTESLRATRLVLTEATARATALRQSILAAAFSGKLVPQDPSDEPASVLLERIRAEHATTKPARRPKAKTP